MFYYSLVKTRPISVWYGLRRDISCFKICHFSACREQITWFTAMILEWVYQNSFQFFWEVCEWFHSWQTSLVKEKARLFYAMITSSVVFYQIEHLWHKTGSTDSTERQTKSFLIAKVTSFQFFGRTYMYERSSSELSTFSKNIVKIILPADFLWCITPETLRYYLLLRKLSLNNVY